jgi:hypothetical protein
MYTGRQPDTYHDHAEHGFELPDTPVPRCCFAVHPLMITIFTAFLSIANLDALPTGCIHILRTALKAIPSVNNIIRSVFVIETTYVLCKVGSKFLLSDFFLRKFMT